MFGVPRTLCPLCLSLTLACIGMALSGLMWLPAAPWWQTMAWSMLAVLFGAQAVAYAVAGRRRGWNTPIEGTKHS